MFKIGDYVFDKNNNDRVQIVDVSMVWDFVSYKVFNPVTGVVYKLSADAIEMSITCAMLLCFQKSKAKPPKESSLNFQVGLSLSHISFMS